MDADKRAMTDLSRDIHRFIEDHRWVTGGDLIRRFGRDPDGGCYGDENLLLAPEVSHGTADAICSLYDAGEITIELISPIVYLLDGIAVDLPYAGELKGYATPHWFPAAFCSTAVAERIRTTSRFPAGTGLPEKSPRLGWQQWLMKSQEQFRCRRCGDCCEDTAIVDLNWYDMERIAVHLNIGMDEMVDRYTVELPAGRMRALPYLFPLRGIRETLPCMFFDRATRGCSIYPVRPLVCRAFPYLETITVYSHPETFNFGGCYAVKEYFDRIRAELGTGRHRSDGQRTV